MPDTPAPQSTTTSTTEQTQATIAGTKATADSAKGIRDQTDAQRQQDEAQRKATVSAREHVTVNQETLKGLHSITNMTALATSSFNLLANQLKGVRDQVANTGTITTANAAAFSVLTNSIIGARVSYEGFAGIDYDNVSTLGSQVSDLSEILKNAASPMEALGKVGAAFNVDVKGMFHDNLDAAKKFVDNLVTSADNSTRLQAVYVQLAAKTGNLSKVYKEAGANLNDMTDLIDQQQKSILLSSEATGIGAHQTAKYFFELGQIPGALQQTVKGAGDTANTVSVLTAAMQFSAGAGRANNDVMKDMHEAYRRFNITGEESLNFTANLSQITNNLGLEFEDVSAGFKKVTGDFSAFSTAGSNSVKMIESVKMKMMEYVGVLKSAGLSGADAINTFSGMAEGIAKLTTGQKAFISAQTGGPGGLLGALKIDKEMANDPAKVFDRVKQQLTRQLGGKLINSDEAASGSQADAARYNRQAAILQSSALGKNATTPKDIDALLKVLSSKSISNEDAKKAMSGTELNSTDDFRNKGYTMQQKQVGLLTQLRDIAQRTQAESNTYSKKLTEDLMTAGEGFDSGNIGDANSDKEKDKIKTDMNVSAFKSGSHIIENNNGLSKKKSGFDDYLSKFAGIADDAAGTLAMGGKLAKKIVNRVPREMESPMERTARESSNRGSSKAQITENERKQAEKSHAVTGSLNVNVTGYCLNCKSQMEKSEQSVAIVPSTQKR